MKQKTPSELFNQLDRSHLPFAREILPEANNDTSRLAIETAYPLLLRHTPVLIAGGLISSREILVQFLANEMRTTPDKLEAKINRYSGRDRTLAAVERVINLPLATLEDGPFTVENILDTALPGYGGRKARVIIIDLNLLDRDREGADELFSPDRSADLIKRLASVAAKEGIKIQVIRPGVIDPGTGPKASIFKTFDPYPALDCTIERSKPVESMPKWRELARRAFYRDILAARGQRTGNPFVTVCDQGIYSPEQIEAFRKLLDHEMAAWMGARGMHCFEGEDGEQGGCDCFDPVPEPVDMSWLDSIPLPWRPNA